MLLVKYDSNGIQQWNRTWNERAIDIGNGVAVDSLDNIYVTGSSKTIDSDMLLVKYDSFGMQQWNRTWGGNGNDPGGSIVINSLDDIYILCRTDSYGAGLIDTALIKYDTFGTQKWYKTWGLEGYDSGSDLTIDPLDTIYLTGTTDSVGEGGYDIFIISIGDNIEPKIIDSTDDFTVEAGYSGIISWIAIDLHPYYYSIELQGTGIVAGPTVWENGTEINYTIPNDLGVGISLYTVNFTDQYGNYILDSISINVEDTTDPIFTDVPSDFTIEVGYSGVSIMWKATDINPGTYTIELQGKGIVTGPTLWSNGSIIIYNIPDGLTEGLYIYTINVTDEYGNSNTHSVTMTIKEAAIPFGYYYLIFLIIGIVTLIITKKRRIKKNFQKILPCGFK